MKRYRAVLLLTCIAVFPSWSQTFSVAVLEDLRGKEAPELSDAVLTGCMDCLFERGLIATNESVGRVERSVFQSPKYGIESAREGYVDFIALLWIRYVQHPSDPDIVTPEAVCWRLVRVMDGILIAEGTAAPPDCADGSTPDERKEDFRKFGQSLAELWAKAL